MSTKPLRQSTAHLKLEIKEEVSESGERYYRATDQFGNTDTAKTPYRAEMLVRAKVDLSISD